MKLIVTIPAYNEEDTIATVIKDIPRYINGIDSVQVLVIDDGSTDGTAICAKAAGADAIFRHEKNKGLGVSFKDALEETLEMGADIVVNIDADGQYDTADIPKLIQPILEDKADIVLGTRDIDSLDFMPRGKKWGNKLATKVTRIFSGYPVKDAQTGYRAFSREASLRMNLSGKYTYVQETLMQAKYKELRILQVPVDFRERKGHSRLISSLTSYATKAGQTIFVTYKDYKPLKLFCYTGGTVSLIGMGLGVRVLVHFAQTATVSPYIPSAVAASLLITVGMGTIVFGILADMFKKQRLLNEEILYRLKKISNGNNNHNGDHNHNGNGNHDHISIV